MLLPRIRKLNFFNENSARYFKDLSQVWRIIARPLLRVIMLSVKSQHIVPDHSVHSLC